MRGPRLSVLDLTATLTRTLVVPTDGRLPEDVVDGVRVSQWSHYVERLVAAKRKIDERIEELGGAGTEMVRSSAQVTIVRLADLGTI